MGNEQMLAWSKKKNHRHWSSMMVKMKSKALFVLALFTIGCAAAHTGKNTNSPKDRTVANSVDDKEFLYKGDKYPVRKKTLERADLRYDIAVLLSAFDRAYSGRYHLPPGVYEKLISDVQALEEMPLGVTESDGGAFCENLAVIFWGIPDNHLRTPRSCRVKIEKHIPDIGKNIHIGVGYHFEVRSINGKRIGLLSLGTEMPDENDLSWEGFEEKIANISNETDGLVIDLRGNRGGLSNNIRWLANYLYGNPAKMVDEIIHLRESAAVSALFYNEAVFDIIDAVEDNQPVQKYLLEEKENELRKFRKLYKKPFRELREVRKGSDANFDPEKGYDKPIRILIDKECGSGCEGGLARFLSHPRVRTYGTNTRGTYHYGDTEPLVLPKSSVIVVVPTSFREFSDGRFIEKVGYAPDIKIPDGHDGLPIVLKELTKELTLSSGNSLQRTH